MAEPQACLEEFEGRVVQLARFEPKSARDESCEHVADFCISQIGYFFWEVNDAWVVFVVTIRPSYDKAIFICNKDVVAVEIEVDPPTSFGVDGCSAEILCEWFFGHPFLLFVGFECE